MNKIEKFKISEVLVYFGVYYKDINQICNKIEMIIDET